MAWQQNQGWASHLGIPTWPSVVINPITYQGTQPAPQVIHNHIYHHPVYVPPLQQHHEGPVGPRPPQAINNAGNFQRHSHFSLYPPGIVHNNGIRPNIQPRTPQNYRPAHRPNRTSIPRVYDPTAYPKVLEHTQHDPLLREHIFKRLRETHNVRDDGTVYKTGFRGLGKETSDFQEGHAKRQRTESLLPPKPVKPIPLPARPSFDLLPTLRLYSLPKKPTSFTTDFEAYPKKIDYVLESTTSSTATVTAESVDSSSLTLVVTDKTGLSPNLKDTVSPVKPATAASPSATPFRDKTKLCSPFKESISFVKLESPIALVLKSSEDTAISDSNFDPFPFIDFSSDTDDKYTTTEKVFDNKLDNSVVEEVQKTFPSRTSNFRFDALWASAAASMKDEHPKMGKP